MIIYKIYFQMLSQFDTNNFYQGYYATLRARQLLLTVMVVNQAKTLFKVDLL